MAEDVAPKSVVPVTCYNYALYEIDIGMNNAERNTYGYSQPMGMLQYPSQQRQFPLGQASYPLSQFSINGPYSVSHNSLYTRSSSSASSLSSVEGSQRGDFNSYPKASRSFLSDLDSLSMASVAQW